MNFCLLSFKEESTEAFASSTKDDDDAAEELEQAHFCWEGECAALLLSDPVITPAFSADNEYPVTDFSQQISKRQYRECRNIEETMDLPDVEADGFAYKVLQ